MSTENQNQNQYKESIEKLFHSLLATLTGANILNADGIDFETVKKENLIATGLHYKDTIFEKMDVSPMVSGMVNTLIAFAPKGGEVISLDVADLQNTFIEFFKSNSHLVEGLDDFITKIENQIK